MRIRNILHKGLKRLYVEDEAKGLPADSVDKLRNMLAFLQDIEDEEEVRSVPVWRAHVMKGNRKGVWSLHVTRNWRLTFRVDPLETEIFDVNLEDYH